MDQWQHLVVQHTPRALVEELRSRHLLPLQLHQPLRKGQAGGRVDEPFAGCAADLQILLAVQAAVPP